ncbi:MAG TPA: transporter [Ignavibacteria bacterium]|nr:transporter [Bacteroidota bacterium]HRI85386.1 transporter [Ignavibacteria bacterium]HRJ99571.1 transporter [Ignavibacteria bacterium]
MKYFLMLIISLMLTETLISQDLEPRNYSILPIGLNAAALGYVYSSGDIVSDANSPVKDLELTSNTIVASYVRTFGLFGKLARVQAVVPFIFLGGDLKINGRDTSGTRNGFADSKIKFGINLIGSPAMEPKEMMQFSEKFVLGTSLVIAVPTGQYFDEKLINIGSNRWGFKPEIGMSYKLGSFYFEFFTGVWMFTKNSEFLKTNTVTQDPILSLQGHISYLFPSKIWVSGNVGYSGGGDSQINGVEKNDYQRNVRSGFTLSVPLSMSHSVKASVNTGVTTRIGGNFTTYSLIYQYIWF